MFDRENISRWQKDSTRRHFLKGIASGIGSAALVSLLANETDAQPHFAPTAKSVIYLFMSGGPSHVDTFDYKPTLANLDGTPIPDSVVEGVHFAQISRQKERPSLKASPYKFRQRGKSGTWVSDLLPQLGSVVDELSVVRSLHSDVFNHDPAVCLLNTGDSRVGRPTMGAWLSYGLGNETRNLPAYVVLTSGIKRQPLLDNYWTSGFLPSQHQGVRFRSHGDPILFLTNPPSITASQRQQQIELANWMNRKRFTEFGDPETLARIEQYEIAAQMQTTAPELVDLHSESRSTLQLYGTDQGRPSFARNCLLARCLVERGVRFVQLYDMGWDSHGSLMKEHATQCAAIDRAAAGLLQDLRQRGLLDETLVIWGGEFGRTPIAEGRGPNWGRDHHPHGFTMWMAGGGIQGGRNHGATDEFGFHAAENRVSVHDFHATALHCLGIDHRQLTFRHQGRDFRLTDVAGDVVRPLLS